MAHVVQFQAWGDRAVVVCVTCKNNPEAQLEPVLARATSAEGVSLAEALAAVEDHNGEIGKVEWAVRNRHGYIREAEDADHAAFIRKWWAGRPQDEPSLDIVNRWVGPWGVAEETRRPDVPGEESSPLG